MQLKANAKTEQTPCVNKSEHSLGKCGVMLKLSHVWNKLGLAAHCPEVAYMLDHSCGLSPKSQTAELTILQNESCLDCQIALEIKLFPNVISLGGVKVCIPKT